MKNVRLYTLFICAVVMSASISGCAWVSTDRYYSSASDKLEWTCNHVYESGYCSYSTDGLKVTLSLADRSNRMTWFGIWPIPFIPVGLFNSTKSSAQDHPSIGITWSLADRAALERDPNGMTMKLEDGRIIKPAKFTYVQYTGSKRNTNESSQPVTTIGQSYDGLVYDLDRLPDKFVLAFQGVKLDGQDVSIPPLDLELMEGSHYNTGSM